MDPVLDKILVTRCVLYKILDDAWNLVLYRVQDSVRYHPPGSFEFVRLYSTGFQVQSIEITQFHRKKSLDNKKYDICDDRRSDDGQVTTPYRYISSD